MDPIPTSFHLYVHLYQIDLDLEECKTPKEADCHNRFEIAEVEDVYESNTQNSITNVFDPLGNRHFRQY